MNYKTLKWLTSYMSGLFTNFHLSRSCWHFMLDSKNEYLTQNELGYLRRCRKIWDTNLMLWGEVNLCQGTYRQGRGRRTCSRGTTPLRKGKRSGLPANLTTAFRTILCEASLNYRSMQSTTTKSRTWSRRWRWWWGPLTGTPRRTTG